MQVVVIVWQPKEVVSMTDEQKRRVVLRALSETDVPPLHRCRHTGESQERVEELMRQYDESLSVTKEVYKHG